MAEFLGHMFASQFGFMDIEIWMEPFAGGAGAGLALLDADAVEEVWLVEKNPSLAALWRTIADDGDMFAARVAGTVPDMALWHTARETLAAQVDGNHVDDADLGYCAFIVNRCSRSGIVAPNVGPIGGKHQNGRWGVGARFNAAELADRIRRVHGHAQRGTLKVWEGDGITRIEELKASGIGDELVVFVDPPYLNQGNALYAHGMSLAQHQRLADALNGCESLWLLTYDDDPRIPEVLYPQCRVLSYEIAHTANAQRVDWEYAVFSDNLRVPDEPAVMRRGATKWLAQHGMVLEAAQMMLPGLAG